MKKPNLLGCPFCGKQPLMEPWHGGGPTKTAIHCSNDECHAEPMVTGETELLAIAHWNTRLLIL